MSGNAGDSKFPRGVLGVTCSWNLYYIGNKTQCFVISRVIGLHPVSTENYAASFNVSLCFLCKEVCGTSPAPSLLHGSLNPYQGSIWKDCKFYMWQRSNNYWNISCHHRVSVLHNFLNNRVSPLSMTVCLPKYSQDLDCPSFFLYGQLCMFCIHRDGLHLLWENKMITKSSISPKTWKIGVSLVLFWSVWGP